MHGASECFPKSCRLRKKKEFERLRHGSKNFRGKWILLTLKKNSFEGPKLGLAVNRKYGGAVSRNRFKRIVRAAFRSIKDKLLAFDILIRPKPEAKNATSQDIKQDFFNIFKEIN